MNIGLKNNLTLEPRLQEYWKKKKFYKENNIMPSSNLEKEFCITHEDKLRLKSFLSDKKDIYSSYNQTTAAPHQ